METPQETGNTQESTLCLVLAEPEKIQDMNLMILKKILKSGCTPLIVTVNKPNKILAKMYAKEGISPESYYVIDTVTQYSGGVCTPGTHVKYVTSPSNLTDLGIAITELIKQMPGRQKMHHVRFREYAAYPYPLSNSLKIFCILSSPNSSFRMSQGSSSAWKKGWTR